MGIFTSKIRALFDTTTEMKTLILGLDGGGKTTLLYQLQLGSAVSTIPTIGFNCESVSYKSVNFTAWDVGGQDKIRVLWRYYYAGTKALIFVVDSSDRARFEEAKDELHKMLAEDELRATTVLVFANKQDLPGAASVSDLAQALGLPDLQQRWSIQAASAKTGEGLYEGLEFLVGANNKRS